MYRVISPLSYLIGGFLLGKSIMKNMRMVCGVGVNDSKTPVVLFGKDYSDTGSRKVIWKCPYYQAWFNMINRCYSENEHNKTLRYLDEVEVCEEWKTFTNFRNWMRGQDWEGRQLDKDLFGSNLYSPDTCVFLTPSANSFIKELRSERASGVTGVCVDGGRFDARITILGERHYGRFSTLESAVNFMTVKRLGFIDSLDDGESTVEAITSWVFRLREKIISENLDKLPKVLDRKVIDFSPHLYKIGSVNITNSGHHYKVVGCLGGGRMEIEFMCGFRQDVTRGAIKTGQIRYKGGD